MAAALAAEEVQAATAASAASPRTRLVCATHSLLRCLGT